MGRHQGQILVELLKEEGFFSFARFGASGEGKYLPTGLEEMSWSVMTPDGSVRDVWLGWDENKVAPDGSQGFYKLTIMPLWSQELHKEYEANPGYIRARKELGLPLTTEQEEILNQSQE